MVVGGVKSSAFTSLHTSFIFSKQISGNGDHLLRISGGEEWNTLSIWLCISASDRCLSWLWRQLATTLVFLEGIFPKRNLTLKRERKKKHDRDTCTVDEPANAATKRRPPADKVRQIQFRREAGSHRWEHRWETIKAELTVKHRWNWQDKKRQESINRKWIWRTQGETRLSKYKKK